MTEWSIPNSVSQLVHLGAILARASGDHCLSCFQLLPKDASRAIFSRVFCSQPCERAYVSDNLKSLSLQDCNRILARIDGLLRSVHAKRSAKSDSGR